MVNDLAAESRSLIGVPRRLVQRSLRQPDGDRGDAEPAGIQCAEGDLQALALCADQSVGVDVGLVVERRCGRDGVQAHLLFGLAEAQPGQIAGHEEARHPARAFTGAREQRVEVRAPAVGDPRLGAVDHVAAVGFRRLALQCRGIRSGLRLGQAVGADLLTREHLRQPAALLLVGAERQQRMRRQAVHADRDRHRRPPRRDLLEHLQIDLVGLAAATPLLRLRQAEQPRGTQLGEDARPDTSRPSRAHPRSGRAPCPRYRGSAR